MTKIDHFMFAVPDLKDGLTWAQDTFGVQPVYGGEHVGLGTCNALLSLGDTYLEIIAPDVQQKLSGNFGARLAELSAAGLVTWAAAGDLGCIADTLSDLNVGVHGPQPTERKTSAGALLRWALLFPRSNAYHPQLPFFIDWMACEHPSKTSPVGGSLEVLRVSTENVEQQRSVFGALGLEVDVVPGVAGLEIGISTKGSQVRLSSNSETLALKLF